MKLLVHVCVFSEILLTLHQPQNKPMVLSLPVWLHTTTESPPSSASSFSLSLEFIQKEVKSVIMSMAMI